MRCAYSSIPTRWPAGIGIDEVQDAIAKGNVNLPTGTLYGKHQAFIVQADGQLMKAADYRRSSSLIVKAVR